MRRPGLTAITAALLAGLYQPAANAPEPAVQRGRGQKKGGRAPSPVATLEGPAARGEQGALTEAGSQLPSKAVQARALRPTSGSGGAPGWGGGVSPRVTANVRRLPRKWRRVWIAKATRYGRAMAWRIVRRRRRGRA